jgi:hypothetical protein
MICVFIEKNLKQDFSYELSLWNRDIGALWLPHERMKIQEFSRVKANERINLDGYTKWISNGIFAIIPTPLSNQIHIVCVNQTNISPPENSHIRISGVAKWHGIRKDTRDLKSTLTYRGDLVAYVEKIETETKEFELPKTVFSYREF